MTEIIEIINLEPVTVEKRNVKCDSCGEIIDYAYTCNGCGKQHACEECKDTYFVDKGVYRDYCPHCIGVADDLLNEAIKLENKVDRMWKKIYKLCKW